MPRSNVVTGRAEARAPMWPPFVPTLGIDFHGVLLSNPNGYKSPGMCDGAPTPRAIEWLRGAARHFYIAIISSRFARPGQDGIDDMESVRTWLFDHGFPMPVTADPEEPGRVHLYRTKPRCQVLLDDRAIQFAGQFPETSTLLAFKPWTG